MEYTIAALLLADIALAAAGILMRRKFRLMESDMEMALSVISNLSAVLGKHTSSFEEINATLEAHGAAINDIGETFAEFKDKFDDIMGQAEEQLKEEEKWNTGLNNILNFCLDDAYNAGGTKK